MLEGVKILSFTHYLQGPSAAQALADLGADVVKVESCKGAYERGWSGCNTYKNGVSVFYLMANRNQRGIALDLKSDEGKETIYTLVRDKGYNVILENFRPGVMDKLGLGYEKSIDHILFVHRVWLKRAKSKDAGAGPADPGDERYGCTGRAKRSSPDAHGNSSCRSARCDPCCIRSSSGGIRQVSDGKGTQDRGEPVGFIFGSSDRADRLLPKRRETD